MSNNDPARVNIYGVNAIGKHIGQAAFTGAMLFLGAGTTRWPWGRVFAVVYLLCWLGLSIALAIGNPGLLNQRGQRVKDATQGTKRWDFILLSLYFVVIFVQPCVAGLDFRNSWSAPVSIPVYVLGSALMVLGFIPLTWSMLVNNYFDVTARIQSEQGQHVISTGPYRIVRHPAYFGLILQLLAMPVAVGAWVAFIPGLVGVIVFVVRTALEDRMLQAELPGYADFAQKTRYRLVPRVW